MFVSLLFKKVFEQMKIYIRDHQTLVTEHHIFK